LKSNEPKPEKRSPAGQIGLSWLCFLSLLAKDTTCGGICALLYPFFGAALILRQVVYVQHGQKSIVVSCGAGNNCKKYQTVFYQAASANKRCCCGILVVFFFLIPAIFINKTAIELNVHLAIVACWLLTRTVSRPV